MQQTKQISNRVSATINGNSVTHVVKKYSSEILNIFYEDGNQEHVVRIGTAKGVWRTGDDILDAGVWRNYNTILVDLNCDVDKVQISDCGYGGQTKVTVIGNVNTVDVSGNAMVTDGVRSCKSNSIEDRPELYQRLGYRNTVDEVKNCGSYNSVLINHAPIHAVQIETPMPLSLIIRSNKVVQAVQGRCDVYVKGKVNNMRCNRAITKVVR